MSTDRAITVSVRTYEVSAENGPSVGVRHRADGEWWVDYFSPVETNGPLLTFESHEQAVAAAHEVVVALSRFDADYRAAKARLESALLALARENGQ